MEQDLPLTGTRSDTPLDVPIHQLVEQLGVSGLGDNDLIPEKDDPTVQDMTPEPMTVDPQVPELDTCHKMDAVFSRAIREDKQFRDWIRPYLSPYVVELRLAEMVVSEDKIEVTLELSAPSSYRVEAIVDGPGLRVQVKQRPDVNVLIPLDIAWNADLSVAKATLTNSLVEITIPRRKVFLSTDKPVRGGMSAEEILRRAERFQRRLDE